MSGARGGLPTWVAVDDAAGAIGYVLVDDVDGNAHVEQVSVHPDHEGSGVGRALSLDPARRVCMRLALPR